MASKQLSSISSRGATLTMPSATTLITDDLQIRVGTQLRDADTAFFWAAIDASHTSQGYESTSLTCTADTTEQTILDITDAGVLTQVVAPELSGSGTVTIRVTVDGVEETFLSETIGTGARFCIGHIIGYGGETTAGNGIGYGSTKDSGFDTLVTNMLMPTPIQTLNMVAIGMKFETSLKVTIQGSVNISATAELENCCACYSLFIPEGL